MSQRQPLLEPSFRYRSTSGRGSTTSTDRSSPMSGAGSPRRGAARHRRLTAILSRAIRGSARLAREARRNNAPRHGGIPSLLIQLGPRGTTMFFASYRSPRHLSSYRPFFRRTRVAESRIRPRFAGYLHSARIQPVSRLVDLQSQVIAQTASRQVRSQEVMAAGLSLLPCHEDPARSFVQRSDSLRTGVGRRFVYLSHHRLRSCGTTTHAVGSGGRRR